MKLKLFTICFLTFISFSLLSQMRISTNLTEVFTWDEKNEEWEKFSTDKSDISFFDLNKDLTLIKHTTSLNTTAYMIKNYKHNEEDDIHEFDLVSDLGNNYYFILDIMNDRILFIFAIDDKTLMVRHTIKNLWMEDEY